MVSTAALLLLACGPALDRSPAGTATSPRVSGPSGVIQTAAPTAPTGPTGPLTAPPATPFPLLPAPIQGVAAEPKPALQPGELCRLPVIRSDQSPWTAAFVAYPSGRLIPSSIHYVPPPSTGDQPFGTYLSSRQVWVPASRSMVSPDGSRYVREEHYQVPAGGFTSRIHVVDMATGKDRIVSDGTSVAVLDFEPEAIYLTGVHWGSEGSGGLWRLDPDTGALTQLYPADMVVRVSNGVAWAYQSAFANGQLIRRDLATGARTVWLEDRSGIVSLAGIDAGGAPLVADANPAPPQGGRLLRVAAAGAQEVLSTGTAFNGDFLARIQWSTDSHGTWLSGEDGIYLYAGGTVTKVASGRMSPAGVCF